MSYFRLFIIITNFILSLYKIQNFVVLPFDTIFIKDKTLTETNYFSNLTQSEIYVNFTIGSNKDPIKCVLRMDKNGFIIYENAYDFINSTTYEKFDKDVHIRWMPSSMRFPSRDIVYLPHYKSYKDFKQNKICETNITNKTEFLRVDEINEKRPNYFNEMFYEYGIIGLQLIANQYYEGIEFVKSLKKANETNSYAFHLYFESIKKNGFSTNNNKGYFLIGEELTDNKKTIEDIEYINCLEVKTYSKLIWGINFTHIYLQSNEKDIQEIEDITHNSEIIATYPYIKGVPEYFEYINTLFFDELFDKNICHIVNFTKHDIYPRTKSYGYSCDSNSKYFIEKLNNKFPNLILYNNDFNRNFTLTKSELFAYNTIDNSDTQLYFLILGGIDDENRWIMGIPFLKKYVLSYDYDKKRIGFYKNYENDNYDYDEDENKDDDYNFFSSLAFKIIMIVIGGITLFLLGMFVNNLMKKSRKKRANELEDDYEYEAHKDKKENNEEPNRITNKDSLGINSE